MVFHQRGLSLKTLTNICNFSVLIFLNFYLIPSVKVSDNSYILPESIKDTINTQLLSQILYKEGFIKKKQ